MATFKTKNRYQKLAAERPVVLSECLQGVPANVLLPGQCLPRRFFYCPWNSVTQDNYYRALDFVYDNREELIGHAVKSRLNQTKTRIKVAFFDCTNTWFETPYDDLTWQMIRFSRKIREELVRKGFSREQIDGYLDGEEFAERLARELLLSEKDVLRMRGCSKEGRFAQPIVTVALAIDQTGFPIDCKVFAGNISELGSIDPMLKSLRDKYAIEDVYFVADRGLNSTESLDKIQQEKLGFVVAQKVSMQNRRRENKCWIFRAITTVVLGTTAGSGSMTGKGLAPMPSASRSATSSGRHTSWMRRAH